MRKRSLLLTAGLWFVIGFAGALAQEDVPTAPTPAPLPAASAPATAEPTPYPLGLPDMHPQGNGTALFPEGSRQKPATPATTSRKRRGSLATGSKQRGRSLDRTLQKADTDPLGVRVAYRRDKTMALAREPELTVLLQRADDARTDVQKRTYLREYYTRLFASIRRMDSSPAMKEHLSLLAQVAEQRYDPKRRVVAGEEDLLNTRESSGNVRLGR